MPHTSASGLGSSPSKRVQTSANALAKTGNAASSALPMPARCAPWPVHRNTILPGARGAASVLAIASAHALRRSLATSREGATMPCAHFTLAVRLSSADFRAVWAEL